MSSSFEHDLQERLEALRHQELLRCLRRIDSPQQPHVDVQGTPLLNFSSNDYLGLANHPLLKDKAQRAVQDFGSGSGSARLICGSMRPHHDLEEALAEFKGAPSALSFSSGYAAALGTIPSLLERDDTVIVDKLIHASLVDAARLSGAKMRVFAHNDLNELEDCLKWASARPGPAADPSAPARKPGRRTLVVIESVYSMDGDQAPLREIVQLKEKYGAWLMVDEAHATGLYGDRRRGLCEVAEVSDQVEIQMGTLGKALGAAGGYICGSKTLVDFLVNRARSFIFSTGPVPAASAAACAGVQLVMGAEGAQRCSLLWDRVGQFREELERWRSTFRLEQANSGTFGSVPGQALFTSALGPAPGAIIPLVVGPETAALQSARTLRERGLLVPAIRYPTVARGAARLRVTLSASHSKEDLLLLQEALRGCDAFSFLNSHAPSC